MSGPGVGHGPYGVPPGPRWGGQAPYPPGPAQYGPPSYPPGPGPYGAPSYPPGPQGFPPPPNPPRPPRRPRRVLDPRSPFLWLVSAAVLISVVLQLLLQLAAPAGTVAALVVAPLFVVKAVPTVLGLWWVDEGRRRRPSALVVAFVLGGSVAALAAGLANEAVGALVETVLPAAVAGDWKDALIAPLDEEPIKALMVVVVLWWLWPGAVRPVDGALVGGVVGVGFALNEDLGYASMAAMEDPGHDLTGALVVTLLRTVTGLISHGGLTSITGVAVVCFLGFRGFGAPGLGPDGPARRRPLLGSGLFALALLLHFLMNSPLPQEVGAWLLRLAVTALGLIVVWLLVLVGVRGLERVRLEVLTAGTDRAELARRRTRRQAVREAARWGGPAAGAMRRRWQRAELDRLRDAPV